MAEKKSIYIGTSEDGTFVLRGNIRQTADNVNTIEIVDTIRFDTKGSCRARLSHDRQDVVKAEMYIVFSCNERLRIYDDEDKTVDLKSDRIEVYSDGKGGCLILLID